MSKLKGWATFTVWPDGSCFLSDSYDTKLEAAKKFSDAYIHGYINLALIPDEAFDLIRGKGKL